MNRAFAYLLAALLCGPLLAGPAVNRTTPDFGRISPSNTVEFAPLWINLGNFVDGKVYPHSFWTSHGTTNQYAALGWLPIDSTPPVRPGYTAEAFGAWAVTNGVIVPKWTWRPIPPKVRTFSKLKVVLALQERGLWTDARAWIDEQGLTDLYLAAQVFTDDNPFFAQGVAALKDRFQIGDAEVEAILDAVEVKQ